jgi:hypothetical protein
MVESGVTEAGNPCNEKEEKRLKRVRKCQQFDEFASTVEAAIGDDDSEDLEQEQMRRQLEIA